MHKNFIIVERHKLRHFMSFHFIFAVDYIRDKTHYTVVELNTNKLFL